jgi:hypothetical protein
MQRNKHERGETCRLFFQACTFVTFATDPKESHKGRISIRGVYKVKSPRMKDMNTGKALVRTQMYLTCPLSRDFLKYKIRIRIEPTT